MNEEIFGTPDHQPEGEGTAPNPSEEGPFLEKNNPAVSPLLENETASIPEQQPSVPNIPQTELPHTEPFAQHQEGSVPGGAPSPAVPPAGGNPFPYSAASNAPFPQPLQQNGWLDPSQNGTAPGGSRLKRRWTKG